MSDIKQTCFVLRENSRARGIRETKYRFAIGNPLNRLIPATKGLIHLWHSSPWDGEVILLIFPTLPIQMKGEEERSSWPSQDHMIRAHEKVPHPQDDHSTHPPYVFKSECTKWGLISTLNGYSNLWCTSSCRTGGWGRKITDLLWLSQNPHGPNSAEGIGPHSSNGKMPQNIMHTIDNCAAGFSLSFRASSPRDSKVKGECSLLLSQARQQHSDGKRGGKCQLSQSRGKRYWWNLIILYKQRNCTPGPWDTTVQ